MTITADDIFFMPAQIHTQHTLQRVRLLVAAKKIPNEEVNIHLKEKPEWFVSQINPHGLVPVIEHNGHLIRESRIAFGVYWYRWIRVCNDWLMG